MINKTVVIADQSIRDRALNPMRSFIVQAPAGSGKTEILSQRFLQLLSYAQNAPEEIVAITFTKKAAAEMRSRIIKSLEFAYETEPDHNDYRHTTWQLANAALKKDQEHHWHLLKNPNRLRILTIDALANFLCRQMPIRTRIGSEPNVCEDASTLYQLAVPRLINHMIDNTSMQPILEHVLLHLNNQVSTLENLLSNLLAHRDQWLPHIMHCNQNQLELRASLEKSLQQVALEKMQLAAQYMPAHIKQTLVLLARHAGNFFINKQPDHPISACVDFVFAEKSSLDAFAYWFGLSQLLITQDFTLRKTVDKRQGFTPNNEHKALMLAMLTELISQPVFVESLVDIAQCPPTVYTDTQWQTLSAITQLMPLLVTQLTLVFQEKGQVDFIELSLSALRALGNKEAPTDLALYLDYPIRHLLIDEFQDTSVTQLHLLEKITAGWEKQDGRTLFLVGDPMQSIYRFRNAQVGIFMRAQTQGIGHIALEPLTLTMNFRSQKNMVDWFNHTFDKIFPATADIPTGRVPYTPAIAAKPAIEYTVQFYPVFSQEKAEEATMIVNTIVKIKQHHPKDSIAILVRSRSHLPTIITALRHHSLPFQAVDIEPLIDRMEIQDLLSLTRALHHRADRIAWLAVLRAPWCGLMLTDLAHLTIKNNTLWESLLTAENNTALSFDALQRIQRIRDIFQQAFLKQHRLSISQWIEGIWIALGGPACLSDMTALQYTQAFFQLVEKIESDSPLLSIEKLTEQCHKLYATADNRLDAIQIMTIHKSKGLEFDHVFLPGLDHVAPPNDAALFRFCDRTNAFGGDDLLLAPVKSTEEKSDPIYAYLNQLENQKHAHEMTRVLYVATTRAKKSLHLLGRMNAQKVAEKKIPASKNSFLATLWPVCETMMPEHIRTASAVLIENKTNVPPRLTRLISGWQLPAISKTLPVMQKQVMLANTVAIPIDLSQHNARIIGITIHAVLQHMTENNSDAHPVISQAQWKSYLHARGLLPKDIPNAIATIQQAIQTIQNDERGRWILAPHAHAQCEWALTHRHGGQTQQVIIDRSFVDKNNIRWIIDYKTTIPNPDEAVDTFLKRQKKEHAEQLNTYASSVARLDAREIHCGLYFSLCALWVSWQSEGIAQSRQSVDFTV